MEMDRDLCLAHQTDSWHQTAGSFEYDHFAKGPFFELDSSSPWLTQ